MRKIPTFHFVTFWTWEAENDLLNWPILLCLIIKELVCLSVQKKAARRCLNLLKTIYRCQMQMEWIWRYLEWPPVSHKINATLCQPLHLAISVSVSLCLSLCAFAFIFVSLSPSSSLSLSFSGLMSLSVSLFYISVCVSPFFFCPVSVCLYPWFSLSLNQGRVLFNLL